MSLKARNKSIPLSEKVKKTKFDRHLKVLSKKNLQILIIPQKHAVKSAIISSLPQ